jgi:DNA-directed RNA polymerase subunit RPC12/RpoP
MPTKDITCTYCGQSGEIEVSGLNRGTPLSKIFRHLGHNPFSGDMHYQCPACGIVLLVSPLDVLNDVVNQGLPEASFSVNKAPMKWASRAGKMA